MNWLCLDNSGQKIAYSPRDVVIGMTLLKFFIV